MDKWHQYLYDNHDITVHTDHQPLETIFKKPLSKAPRRLQRMMPKLQKYQFTVRYKNGKELYVVDTLARAAVTVADPDHTSFADKQECEVFRLELEEMDLTSNRVTADTLKWIRQETAKDPVLAALQTVVTNGQVGPQKGKKHQGNSEFTETTETSCQFMMFSTSLIKSLSQLLYDLRCYGKYIKRTKGQTVA